MSALRFEVHVDKENAAPARNISRGEAVNKFAPTSVKNIAESNRRQLPQSARRKALADVINDPASRNVREKPATASKGGFCSSLKSSCQIACDVENVHENLVNTKGDFKKTVPSIQQLKVQKDTGSSKSKLASTQNQKEPPKPKSAPQIIYEDYDSDAIFPTSERLSSYVNRLLTWRPPCLFGALPDSESDNSDLEQLPEDILLDMQLPTPTVPEFSDEDLVNLMNNLPPQKPGQEDREQDGGCEDKDIELSLDQTIDTSFSFGGLHVMHGSLEISDSNSSTDLDLNTT